MIVDIARHLAIANPNPEQNPLEGNGIVLIDELDLHLHPRWQRSIVGHLQKTFPNLQFIATTHSPQIIGEVEHEKIILLDDSGTPYHPQQSLGMDTNWILQFMMEASDRNAAIAIRLATVGDLIEDEAYDQAQSMLDELRKIIPDDLQLTRLQARLDRTLILGE
jgi:predicted ATP-binding protein involved in virulence